MKSKQLKAIWRSEFNLQDKPSFKRWLRLAANTDPDCNALLDRKRSSYRPPAQPNTGRTRLLPEMTFTDPQYSRTVPIHGTCRAQFLHTAFSFGG